MPMKCLGIFLLTCMHIFTSLPEGFCQQRYDVSYHFQTDTITLSGPQTFSNKITITNHSQNQITLMPSAESTQSLSGMIRLPAEVRLAAGETKTLPLKYMADRRTITLDNQPFTIGLQAANANLHIQPAKSFYTRLEAKQTVLLEPNQKEIYIDPTTRQLQLLLRVQNTGLASQTILPSFSGFPPGFEITGETAPLNLAAGGQTLLTFTARMPSTRVNADFDLRIQALDAAGKVLAATSTRIMSAVSVKRFGSPAEMQNLPYRNSIAMRYIDMGSYSSIYQLQGYGGIDTHQGGALDYRMTLDYYKEQNAFNMYDSYLDYQTKDWGVKVGNIYENLDQSVNGRGIKANYNIDAKRSVSVYAVENKYMLFSQMFDFLDGGETFGARYAIGPKYNEQASITYLHRNDAFRGVNSDLASAKKQLAIGKNQDLLLEAGYSQERSENNQTKHAASFGLNYNSTFADYQLSSINYYSSPYYAGLRRGLTQSDTRISKVLSENNRLSARINYMDNKPTYQNNYTNFYFNNTNSIQIYELGYLLGRKKIQLELKPYYMAQHAQFQNWYSLTALPRVANSRSSRLAANINFFFKDHRFSALTDYGYTSLNQSNKQNSKFHSLRFTGNYSFRQFGFNSFIQLKPYYLTDLFSTASPSDYSIYTLGPNIRMDAFNGRLQTQAAAMYSHYGFSGSNNFSLNADLQWELKNSWRLTAQLYYTIIKGGAFYSIYDSPQPDIIASPNYTFDNRQIRIGIEKNFGRKGSQKGYKLQLLLYEDINNNRQRDSDERSAAGVLVKIGDQGAVTDSKGRVKFLEVASGSHVINIENNQGWVPHGPVNIMITKNKTMQVPLIITKSVKGSIKLAVNKYIKSSPQLGGIRINAVDMQGREYHTLSDAQGNYTFYLPTGNYRFSISTQGMPFSIQNTSLQVQVGEENQNKIPDFIYKDERRKIEIKRF